MKQHSTEPEYILAESEKIRLTEKPQACTDQTLLDLEAENLRSLYVACSLQEDISRKILDLVRELEQSVREQR